MALNFMPWRPQFGRWDFKGYGWGFIESDKVLTLIYLFVSWVKSLHLSS